ncbi:hypothetical protein RHODO2019_15980 [Rhodococcus antarcticus]|uniref:Uncharacterized protein n=1 Tax=Rhodococcus antarcticus TaxID=2987751 RepID=A0ABY6NYY1_9NOCA|nr:hypothetical protein [Rhodococcus antarcticus]UZJ24602.1 hypothetical protein RHODO2019_15980 [Rhodococcus antarcticus]
MARLVHDRDGRAWTVSSRAHLVGPGASQAPVERSDAVLRTVLLGTSALLVVVVLLSTPASLWLPGWVVGPVLLAAGAVVATWALGRPFSVNAATAGTVENDAAAEDVRWVTGPWSARREVRALSAELEAWSTHPGRDLAGDLPFRA